MADVKGIDLPEDVIRDILSWLPVQSLMRFRSVCKSWCSLVRNQDFIAKHHSNQTLVSNTSFLVKHEAAGECCFSVLSLSSGGGGEMNTVVNTTSVPFLKVLLNTVDIFGAVNGLVCLYQGSHDSIVLYNPATREFKRVPSSTHPSFSSIGFGFDEKTNDYKIIRFACTGEDNVELYSLKSDSWRDLPCVDVRLYTMEPLCGCINGISYWLAKEPFGRKILLSFDFASEVFEKLLLPFDFNSFLLQRKHRSSQLGTMNERPSTFDFHHCEANDDSGTPQIETCVDIWTMVAHGVELSWKKLELIAIQGYLRPFGVCKNYVFLDDRNRQLVLYDLSTKQVHHLQLYGGNTNNLQFANYVESLVQINGTRG